MSTENETVDWGELYPAEFEKEKAKLLDRITRRERLPVQPLSEAVRAFNTRQLSESDFKSFSEAIAKSADAAAEWLDLFDAKQEAAK